MKGVSPVFMANGEGDDGAGGGEIEEDGNLPENWRMSVDKKNGRTYYWNVETREVSWYRPLDEGGSGGTSTTLVTHTHIYIYVNHMYKIKMYDTYV